MPTRTALHLTLTLLAVTTAARAGAPRPHLWVRAGCNFQLDQDTDRFISLIGRAKAAGYTGVLFHDSKLARPRNERPATYWENIERARKAAEAAGIELIPEVAPLSFSNAILANNPHMAEGVAVRDCLFRVRDGRATVANPRNLLPFGNFEEFADDRPGGWDWLDGAGQSLFQDRTVKRSGDASVRMEDFHKGNPHGLCRLMKKLSLKPWHQYHLRLWIRTENVPRPEAILVLAQTDVDKEPRYNLHRRPIEVQGTQDWRPHDVVFNTFGRSEVWVYIGAWDAGGGRIWIDDVSLREVAGINLLRRDGCPIAVRSEDGRVEYDEGRDFHRWEYPKMGRVPYPGVYEVMHPQPPLILTSDSRIREGQRLKVSFYHTLHILHGSVGCCLRSDEVFDSFERQIRLIKELLPETNTYLMKHDEVRLAGWCGLCDSPEMTAGQILAEHVRRTTGLIRRIDPGATIAVWSDMYDPNHNAVDNYWHTRGTMRGSWEGLDRDVIVANWNQGRRHPSLKFFAGRGHPQIIATYFDRANWQQVTLDWLKSAEGIPRVGGVIYTTWQGEYKDLEDFANLVARGSPAE